MGTETYPGPLDEILRAISSGATGFHGAPPAPEPPRNPFLPDVPDLIGRGVRAVIGSGLGPEAEPAPPPLPVMRPTPRQAPPSSRGVPLRPSEDKNSSSTQGGTATGPLNPAVAGLPPRIPAWMAAGSQDRPRFGSSAAQDEVFQDLAGHLGSGDTLSRVAPGSMANVMSDIGFDETMDARDRASLARTNTSIEQEKAAQVLDDLTGGTAKRIRGQALDNALVDMLPAGSTSRVGATFGRGWGPGLSGAEVGSSGAGQRPLDNRTIGEEKAIDRVIAGQAGKTASVVNERQARQAQLQIIDDLRHKKGMIQAKLAAGAIDAASAEREFDYEKQLADRELQALGGGKDFLSQYKNDMGGDSVFATPGAAGGYGPPR